MPLLTPTPPLPSFPPYRHVVPKIEWGAAFVNTLAFGYPLVNVQAYSASRDGLETLNGRDGGMDAWHNGNRYLLEGTIDIPPADWVTHYGPGTGWTGATGWRAFLQWARETNQFRFYPSAALGTFYLAYLVDPWDGAPEPGWDFTRRLSLRILSAAGVPFLGY